MTHNQKSMCDKGRSNAPPTTIIHVPELPFELRD